MDILSGDIYLYVSGQLPSQVSGLPDRIVGRPPVFAPRRGDRRCAPRFSSQATADLRVLSPLLADRSHVAIVNVSTNGLALVTKAALQPGVIAQVRTSNAFVLGEVRYCLPVEVGFLLGLKVQDCL
jgi:hypothetical protein